MTTGTQVARDFEALRRQEGTRQVGDGQQPDAQAMGAETAEYTAPTLDPQWLDAYKMFIDRDGNEYGVPCKLPRGQWAVGGPNALMNQRRPDGGYWFRLADPDAAAPPVRPVPQFECFVGECTKRVHRRIDLVKHVRAFHFDEAEVYKEVLTQIEQKVAQDDPRLQRVLASLDAPEQFGPSEDELELACPQCGKTAPADHADPAAWLRGHTMGAHKEGD